MGSGEEEVGSTRDLLLLFCFWYHRIKQSMQGRCQALEDCSLATSFHYISHGNASWPGKAGLSTRQAGKHCPGGHGRFGAREGWCPRAFQQRLELLLHSMSHRSGLCAPLPLLGGVGQVIVAPLPGTRKIALGSTSVPYALPYLTRISLNPGFTSESRGRGR